MSLNVRGTPLFLLRDTFASSSPGLYLTFGPEVGLQPGPAALTPTGLEGKGVQVPRA